MDPSGWLKPPVDSVPTVLAVDGPLLQLPTARAGWRNIPNPSQQDVTTILMGHLVLPRNVPNRIRVRIYAYPQPAE